MSRKPVSLAVGRLLYPVNRKIPARFLSTRKHNLVLFLTGQQSVMSRRHMGRYWSHTTSMNVPEDNLFVRVWDFETPPNSLAQAVYFIRHDEADIRAILICSYEQLKLRSFWFLWLDLARHLI